MKFAKILGITFLISLCFAVSVAAGCYQAGSGSLRLLTGTILPYDDEGCEAGTSFTGCYANSQVELMDNYLAVSATYKYYNLSGNLASLFDSKSANDIFNVSITLEGTTDDGITATSKHTAVCNIDNKNYSQTLTKNY